MRKKLLFAGTALVLIAAAVTGYSAYSKSNSCRLLQANIEALAGDESGGSGESDSMRIAFCAATYGFSGPSSVSYTCSKSGFGITHIYGTIYPCASGPVTSDYGSADYCYVF